MISLNIEPLYINVFSIHISVRYLKKKESWVNNLETMSIFVSKIILTE